MGLGILANGGQGTVSNLLLPMEILSSSVKLSPSNMPFDISFRLLKFSSRCFSLFSPENVPFSTKEMLLLFILKIRRDSSPVNTPAVSFFTLLLLTLRTSRDLSLVNIGGPTALRPNSYSSLGHSVSCSRSLLSKYRTFSFSNSSKESFLIPKM